MKLNQRFEIKFNLSTLQEVQFELWMLRAGAKKKFSDRIVNSVYFDTPLLHSACENLSGDSERQKRRVRWYNPVGKVNRDIPAILTLELKNKQDRLGSKKSIQLKSKSISENRWSSGEFNRELCRACVNAGDSSILTNPLIPTLKITYRRSYYEFGDFPGRITIDRQIRAILINNHSMPKSDIINVWEKVIGEIKFAPDFQGHVVRRLNSLHLMPSRHSKYLAGLASYGLVQYI